VWITAATQAPARRRGASWVSAPGNLFATLLLTDRRLPMSRLNCLLSPRWRCTDALAECAPATGAAAEAQIAERLLLGVQARGLLIERERSALPSPSASFHLRRTSRDRLIRRPILP